MSITVHLVIRITGEYDEYRERPVHGWTNKERAEEHISTLQKEQEIHNDTYDKLLAFRSAWETENPAPTLSTHKLLRKVKWPSGLRREQITDEMRNERQRVEDYNQKVYDAHGEECGVWYQLQRETELAFLKQIGATEKFIHTHQNDSMWMSRKNAVFQIQELLID
jgi:hypothetical protein